MTLNFTNDYLQFDGKEPVTYFVRTTEALPTTGGVTVNNCLRVTTLGTQQQGMGLMGKNTTQWHMWTPELGTITPKIGDVFTDSSGAVWAIIDTDYTFLTGKFTLSTVRGK